jgi:hypothetical protein
MKLARGINLSDEEVANLTRLAKNHRAFSRSGPTTGEPSWRVLVMAIAAGEIELPPPTNRRKFLSP